LGDQAENNEMGGSCSTYGRDERGIRVLVGELERKRPLGRTRLRWEENNNMS
jgi:hypothetical protein